MSRLDQILEVFGYQDEYHQPDAESIKKANAAIRTLVLNLLNGAQSNLRRKYQLNRSQRHGMDILSEEIRQKVNDL